MAIALEKKDQTPDDEYEIVRFFLCLLFNCFLFRNLQGLLRNGLLCYIEDLGDLHNINWAEAVLKYTMEKIGTCQARVCEREDGGRGTSHGVSYGTSDRSKDVGRGAHRNY